MIDIFATDTDTSIESSTETKDELAPNWQVIVLNDPVNLMSYVQLVFRKVFGYSDAKAQTLMLEVHNKGRSCVWQGEREQAELYVQILQKWQLNTILARSV